MVGTAQALGTNMTLSELVRRENPDGSLATLVDALSQVNDIIRDATWIECNRGTSHQATRIASEPTGSDRVYNQGIPAEAGVTEIVTEPVQFLDGFSNVDEALYRHTPGGVGAAMVQEDNIVMKGMAKTFVSRLFDGDRTSNPAQINGINNRTDYNTLSSEFTFDNAGGNSADNSINTSIYIIQWGAKKVNLIYPRNDPQGGALDFGIKRKDMGEQMVAPDSNAPNNKLPMLQTWFEIHFGIFIHDRRMIKRIVNIGTSGINGTSVFSFDEDPVIDAVTNLEDSGEGAIMYVNRTVMAQIWKRVKDKGNAMYTQDSEGDGVFARPVAKMMGIPVHRVDQITSDQDDIT